MKKYYKYIKPYWIFFVLSPLLMLIEVYCDVKIPELSAQIINDGVMQDDVGTIIKIAGIMLVFIVVAISSGVGASYCSSKASVQFSCDLRDDVFKKIQSFSFANIDKFSTGSLVTRLTNDITQMQQLVNICLRMMFRAPGMLIGAIFMAFTISPDLAIIFVVLVPILATVITVILKMAYKKFASLQVKIDALNSNIREILTNIRVVKALTRENYENGRFEKVNDDLKDTGLKAYRLTILQMPIMTVIVNFATITLLWFASQAFNTGTILIGDISTLITYLTQILMSINMLAMIFLQSSRAVVCSNRILEVLDTNVDISDDNASLPEKRVTTGDIRFENVNFKYYKNNKELVLSNINVDIKSGQTVGIIGSTGCGKTSLVNLIPRLYDVDSGKVYVDGADVKDYSLTHLRDGVAIVLQNNVLFSGSIEDNLRWGGKEAIFTDIERVSKWAAAGEFIEAQEFGYDTWLGQGGVNLSGGQKQRLCIARALLKNPKILILDDSTSAVDTATEGKINSHLHGELNKTTKIIIAQRVNSVIDSDIIIVMNDGKIEAMGKHDDLLENCETYREIHNSQMDKEEGSRE